MKRSVRALCGILLAVVALLFVGSKSGCGPYDSGSEDITVLVTVEGLTGAVSSLSVSTTLDGRASLAPIPDLTQRLDKFAIYLPRSTSGRLGVNLVGHSADGCVVAKGQAEVDVRPAPPTFVRLSVPISTSAVGATKQCALKVELYGTGKVTSTPAGIDCSATDGKAVTCSGDFPVGTNVTLNSTVDAKVYGVAFEGVCKGAGSCSFMFNTPGTVRVGFGRRVCSKDNWCWYSPLPHGVSMRGVWGSASDDYWAVGEYGTIMHFDGGAWSGGAPSGFTSSDLYSVYGTSKSDIWAVGTASGLVHYDGTAWTVSPQSGVIPVPTQTLRAVWGRAPNDYWAVGTSGVILHFDGSAWSEGNGSRTATPQTLLGVWGSAANDIWAVGTGGAVLHYNGTQWTVDSMASGISTATSWFAISGTAADRIVAVGSSGRVMRYNGTVWALDAMSGSIGLSQANSVWTSGTTAITVGSGSAGGYGSSRSDGNAWQYTAAPGSNSLNGVWGTSPTDLWAAADTGTMMHYDGSAWAVPQNFVPRANYSLQKIWGSAPNDVWTVGSGGTVRRFNGDSWSSVSSGTTNSLQDVWGFNSTNVFAVGASGTFQKFDGQTWSAVPYAVTPGPTNTLNSVWGSSASSVWATGTTGLTVLYNGTNLSVNNAAGTLTNGSFNGVHGTNSSTVFSVGIYSLCPPAGTINCNMFRYNGGSWGSNTFAGGAGTNSLLAVWGYSTPTTRFWAVGYSGAIALYDAGTWTTHAQSGVVTTAFLYDVWGTSANNIFAVGSAPAIIRYDGATWTNMDPGMRSYALYGVWTGATNDAWAVGSSGVLLRYMP